MSLRIVASVGSEERLEKQCGFFGGQRGNDGTFSLKLALKRRREHGKHFYVIFVDLVKAFDSTPRDVLFAFLTNIGMPPRMQDVIWRIHQDVVASKAKTQLHILVHAPKIFVLSFQTKVA